MDKPADQSDSVVYFDGSKITTAEVQPAKNTKQPTFCDYLKWIPIFLAISLILGVAQAIWFYYLLETCAVVSVTIGAVVFFILFISQSLSKRFRASLASAPTFFGTTFGNILLSCLLFGVLLPGPAENLRKNADRFTQSYLCASGLLENQSMGFEEKLGQSLSLTGDTNQSVFEQAFTKLQQIQDFVGATNHMSLQADEGLDYFVELCERNLDVATRTCRDKASLGQTLCQNKVGEIKSWVHDMVQKGTNTVKDTVRDALCHIVGGCPREKRQSQFQNFCERLDMSSICSQLPTSSRCTPEDVIPMIKQIKNGTRDISTTLEWLIDIFNRSKQVQDAYFHHESRQVSPDNGTFSAVVFRDSLARLGTAIQVLKIILSVLIWAIIPYSWRYLSKWLLSDDFDNRVISKDFRKHEKIDQLPVLPLKSTEKEKLLSTGLFSLRPSISRLALWIAVLAICVLFCVSDQLLYRIGIYFRARGLYWMQVMESQQDSGMTTVLLHFVSEFLDISFTQNVRKCLPMMLRPNPKFYVVVALVLLIVLLSFLQDNNLSLLRANILHWFFPQRSAVRAQYLREKLQKRREKRKNLLFLLANAEKSKDRHERKALLNSKLVLKPGYQHRPAAKKCFSCGELFSSGIGKNSCEECLAEYCDYCWNSLLESNCLLCKPSV